MALGEAILTCLVEQPMSGYDLARSFQTSIGFFWKADHQQIYRELAKLRERGWIEGREVIQSGIPNKFVYTILPAGRAALRAWSARSAEPPTSKDDLLVRLYALGDVDLEAVRIQITQRLEFHQGRLARYETILAKSFTGRELTPRELGRLLGLKFGLRRERATLDWCQEALELLPREPGATISELPSSSSAPRRA